MINYFYFNYKIIQYFLCKLFLSIIVSRSLNVLCFSQHDDVRMYISFFSTGSNSLSYNIITNYLKTIININYFCFIVGEIVKNILLKMSSLFVVFVTPLPSVCMYYVSFSVLLIYQYIVSMYI